MCRGRPIAVDEFCALLTEVMETDDRLVPRHGPSTEFEVLTGMSLGLFPPQLRVPFQMLVPERTHFPSLVQWYERSGHRPVAVHPFSTEMYRRRDVYRAFGFDEFVHEGTLRHAHFAGGEYGDLHLMSILRDEWQALDRKRSWDHRAEAAGSE